MNHVYRVYADGTVVHQDDFHEIPEDAGDDYSTYVLPSELIQYIQDL